MAASLAVTSRIIWPLPGMSVSLSGLALHVLDVGIPEHQQFAGIFIFYQGRYAIRPNIRKWDLPQTVFDAEPINYCLRPPREDFLRELDPCEPGVEWPLVGAWVFSAGPVR